MNDAKSVLSVLTTCVLLLGSGQISTVLAQDQSGGYVLEEIIVTATKREAQLQDVGISISAISGERLDRLGITDAREILRAVPNMIVNEVGGDANPNIYLRGVGAKSLDIQHQTGVGVYTDEIFNAQVVANVQTYDLERVEVLKGPQNSLYGRNTTGGAINYISRKPVIGGRVNGYIDGTYGRFDQVDVKGAFGAPLGDNAAVRIAGIFQTRDGYRTNLITGRDDGERERYAGRLSVAWEPTENVSVNLKGHIERGRGDNFIYLTAGRLDATDPSMPCSEPFKRGLCATGGNGYVPPASTRRHNSDMAHPRQDMNSGGISAQIVVDLGAITLTSITGYEENSLEHSEDTDALPSPGFHWILESWHEQWSQEVRLSSDPAERIRWIAGAYGYWEDVRGGYASVWDYGQPWASKSYSKLGTDVYSGYGEVEFDVSDSLTFKGGVRYSSDTLKGWTILATGFDTNFPGIDIEGALYSGDQFPDFLSVMLPAGQAGGASIIEIGGPNDPDANVNDTNFSEWGGKVGFDWKPNDDVLVYAHWAHGFKAGRFTSAPRAIREGVADIPFSPEKVDSYEIGIKTEFWNKRARVNVAGFFNDYDDQQLAQFQDGVYRILSADSEIYGAEVEASLAPAEGLLLSFSLGFLDTEITKAPDPAQEGNRLIGSPEFSANYSVLKEWTTPSGNVFGVGIDGRYVGKQKFDIGSPGSGFQQGDDAYHLMNAQGYFQFGPDGRHRMMVWGKNLTDEEIMTTRFGWGPGRDVFVLTEPVTYGVSYRMDF